MKKVKKQKLKNKLVVTRSATTTLLAGTFWGWDEKNSVLKQPEKPVVLFGATIEEVLGKMVIGPCRTLPELKQFVKENEHLAFETVGRNLLRTARPENEKGCLIGIEIDITQNLDEWISSKPIPFIPTTIA